MQYFALILFIIICTAIQIFGNQSPDFFYGVSNAHLWHSFTYPFVHGSWLHLILNMFALGIMLPPISKIWDRKICDSAYSIFRLLAASYIASVIAGAACAGDIPTVGASGMAFFLLGVLVILNPTLNQLKSLLWVAAAVAIQIYFGKSNTALHLTSFAFGALYTIYHEFLKQYVNRTIY